jgi:hypothetical protein
VPELPGWRDDIARLRDLHRLSRKHARLHFTATVCWLEVAFRSWRRLRLLQALLVGAELVGASAAIAVTVYLGLRDLAGDCADWLRRRIR